MREKDSINLKNKINLKNFLVKKAQQSFNLQSINIQTITQDKTHFFFNEDKKFNNTKFTNKIRYLSNTLSNNNINNNYLLNDDQMSFFSLYNSNKEPSPINSVNSSPYSTYTQKKRNYKKLQQKYRYKYNNFNINTSNSINNLSLNSKIINTNQSVSLSSSSSSSYNDCSDSSDVSYRSRKNKRKNYKELMMAEEDDLDYLKRREVGLVSDDEEENNTSIENNNSLEENFSNEIERILIEIYNKNISIISSGNYNDINKNKNEIEEIEKQIKKFLKKKNLKTNLLVLKCLSNKIKELVGKYKEKVFEIEEIKAIYDTCKLKMQLLRNNHIIRSNNSVGSNDATNLNSSYDSYGNEEENFKNSFLLNVQNEITGKGISNILLRELINIKKTLKISSKEIEGIFKYPLSLLKKENGKRLKFSVELMQLEEFCKTLLNDDFIFNLLGQMKNIFSQISIPNVAQWIEEVLEDCDHKNEMTRFVKFINEKLGITNEKNDNNKKENNYLDEYKINENLNDNNTLEEQIGKNIVFSLDTGSSNEGTPYKNEKIIKNQNKDFEEYNNNNDSNKKTKKKKRKNNESENKNENNKINFEDIDELLNYINDETESKKGKKKSKKGRKNKKQNNNNKEKDIEDNNLQKNNQNNNEEENLKDNDEEFEKIFNDFKRDIEKDSVYICDINKIEPCLSNDFITKKCAN
jgi:hypothetical protein